MDIIKLVNAFKLVQNNYFSDKNYKNSMRAAEQAAEQSSSTNAAEQSSSTNAAEQSSSTNAASIITIRPPTPPRNEATTSATTSASPSEPRTDLSVV